MITAYHRPRTLDEALKLLAQPDTRPLGGGTWLNQPHEERLAVVDLQLLGLGTIGERGNELVIGATATLEELLAVPSAPPALKAAAKLETTLNLRNMGTVAGTLVTADGRSPFGTALLALDARLTLVGGDSSSAGVGELFGLRDRLIAGRLITEITIPLKAALAFDYVARTPADRPIIAVALCKWASGRTRFALGGFGPAPLLGMDGTDSAGLAAAARNAFHEAADEWASAEYRMDAAVTLAKRCLQDLG